ncbi:hypothetical protein GCM10009678_24260 [Actinomadura kijaniata]
MFAGFVRDRGALFLTVLFPLLFLVVFAGVFGHQSTPRVRVVQVGAAPVLEQAVGRAGRALTDTLAVERGGDRAAALRKVAEGDADAVVEQHGNVLVAHYSVADPVKAGTVRGLLGSIVQSADVAASGREPRFSLRVQRVEDESLGAVQFFTPSLLGWALASAGVFGASQTLVTWRTRGLLRRLRLSPAPIWALFGARVVVSVAVALLQLAVFLGVASLPFFGLRLQGAWWMAVPLVVAGVLAFLAIGMVIGAWARTQESAQTVTQLVVLPMAFLGGSFFPLDGAPGWMRTLSHVFPLRYLNEGMLNVMGRGLGAGSAVPQLVTLLGIAAVGAVVAVRMFRWDAS